MKLTQLAMPDVCLIETRVFGDERGFFFESFNQAKFEAAIGRQIVFVQDKHSHSVKTVLRGPHYQIQQPQGKLLRVVQSEVFDVAIDNRRSSPTFGHWVRETLSAKDKRKMWVPEGFAHSSVVLFETVEFLYKTTDCYAPEHERGIVWNDPCLSISWPIESEPVLPAKDAGGAEFQITEVFP